MANSEQGRARRRTLGDRLISGFNHAYYGLTKPVRLRHSRRLHDAEYSAADAAPLISVYAPTYNRAELLLERAVKSVLNQSYTNFEFVIVGDCCTDRTAELVATVKDPRLRFYNLPERRKRYPDDVEIHWFAGPVVAANTALGMVRGKWIARIDDDDTWTEDHLETLLRSAQQGDYEFVSAAYLAVRDGKETVVDAKDDRPRIGGTQTWLYRSYLRFFRYNIHCWRKSWNRVNDIDLQVRMHRAGVRMGFLDKVVAAVLPRPGETTIGLEAYRRTAAAKQDHFRFGA